MDNAIGKTIKAYAGSEPCRIEKLHGDASYRTYHRAHLADGRSFIVMQMPEGRSSASEEVTNFKGPLAEPPFIDVARYLKNRRIPVPEVFHYDENARIIVLKDLGDDLMARRVEASDDTTRIQWYRRAVDLLCLVQERTAGGTSGDCVAFDRSFDEELLNWEFDHFIEYGIEARLGVKMVEEDLAIFRDETRAISTKIASLPRGFTHRDYQSRNLIVHGGELHVIDFQDALLGPAAYDLTALLRDSYVELSSAIVEEMIGRYAEAVRRDISELMVEFDLITVQRKLKDAGRFVYIERVKGNPDFLRYIPRTLAYVESALARLPEHAGLKEALMRYVPEWGGKS